MEPFFLDVVPGLLLDPLVEEEINIIAAQFIYVVREVIINVAFDIFAFSLVPSIGAQ